VCLGRRSRQPVPWLYSEHRLRDARHSVCFLWSLCCFTSHNPRCFEDDDIIHVHDNPDPVSDLEVPRALSLAARFTRPSDQVIEMELLLADLQSVDKRLASATKKVAHLVPLALTYAAGVHRPSPRQGTTRPRSSCRPFWKSASGRFCALFFSERVVVCRKLEDGFPIRDFLVKGSGNLCPLQSAALIFYEQSFSLKTNCPWSSRCSC
jgi:hypothetical protein